MTLMLIAGPAEEPVTLEEARAHLRLDVYDDDILLMALITAARARLEAETRRAFITQSWRLLLDTWPGHEVTLPLAPVSAVSGVSVFDAQDAATMLSAYQTDLAHEPPRLVATQGWTPPGRRVAGIVIDFIAGYGAAADVPGPLKQAVLMLAAYWFEHRVPESQDARAAELPQAVRALAAPYRRLHL